MGTPLADGLWHFQTPLWQTNSLLAVADGEALVCDPAYTADEIMDIRTEAESRAGNIGTVLLTHADFDHTCGIGSIPDAEVVAGATTEALVASGEAAEALRRQAIEWGESWSDELRVDRVVEADETVECGPFRVLALEAAGHTADGLAFLLLDQGVLLPGDYLSPMTYPFATASVADALATTRRLLAVLDEHRPDWTVPGHGAPLETQEAMAVGEADVVYLERLLEASGEARAKGLSPGRALLHVFSVEPPRATTEDFEVYGLRAWNARQALEECA